MAKGGNSNAKNGSMKIDPGPNEEISRRLKAMFREVEAEGIPERFMDLLEKLDHAEKSQKAEVEK